MCDLTDFDYSIEDGPQRYGKEWWQDFRDRIIAYYEDPEYEPPQPVIVRSLKEWEALDGRWSWPKS